MNNFIYETPTKVYFGKDEELKVGKIIAEFHPKKVRYISAEIPQERADCLIRWRIA